MVGVALLGAVKVGARNVADHMNRRKFFGVMAGAAAIPVVALAKMEPIFDPVVYTRRLEIDVDMSLYSAMDAANWINKLATRIPAAYRLTVGPWLYIEAHSTAIRDAMRDEYQTDIVVVMNRAITNCDEWWLDACGIKIWSPGA